MSQIKHQILPNNLIQNFYNSFSIYSLLVHVHSLFKIRLKPANPVTYNFNAFLTLDKSRKIIRKKEDEFVAEMILKIEKEARQFMERNFSLKELYKMSYAELQKFIELFECRKGQFTYFQKALAEIEKVIRSTRKEKQKHEQTLQKMKSMMDDFQEKLILVAKKYQEKTHISFSTMLKTNPFHIQSIKISTKELKNQNTQKHSSLMEPNKFSNEKKSNSIKESLSRKKTIIIKKFGDVSLQISAIEHLKQETMNLKTKYSKLNSKIQIPKIQNEDKESDCVKFPSEKEFSEENTESDVEDLHTFVKDQQTKASDVKYSIRLTQERKKSKLNTSFSIFSQKSSHHASFFLKNNNKVSLRPESRKGTFTDYAIKEETQKSIPQQFLRKRSFLLKNTGKNAQGYFQKKSNNSVYRQTNFAIEVQRKSSNLKRISIEKPRESLGKNTDHKSYHIRTSQTNVNREETLNQEEVESPFYADNTENIIASQGEVNRSQNFMLGENKMNEDEENLDDKFMNKKSNNRRTGFSKKNLDATSDDEPSYVPTMASIERKSSLWNQNSKQEKPYNRTSFFRSSGYTQKKSLPKPGKTKFNNFSKKLNRNDSKDHSSDAVIDTFPTQKSIRAKGIHKDRVNRGIKPQQMAITAKDCKQLFQEISEQVKIDQSLLHQTYIWNMMRQKYDLKFKSEQLDDEDDDYRDSFANQMFKMIEEDPNDGENEMRKKWAKGNRERNDVRFFQAVARKYNELGQKNMDFQAGSWEDEVEYINF